MDAGEGTVWTSRVADAIVPFGVGPLSSTGVSTPGCTSIAAPVASPTIRPLLS